MKIPLNPPLLKGDFQTPRFFPKRILPPAFPAKLQSSGIGVSLSSLRLSAVSPGSFRRKSLISSPLRGEGRVGVIFRGLALRPRFGAEIGARPGEW